MLTNEERLKVARLYILVKSLGVTQWSPQLNHENVAWLCKKLNETDRELKNVTAQRDNSENSYDNIVKELTDLEEKHDKLDQMLATALQVVTNAGLMKEYLRLRSR